MSATNSGVSVVYVTYRAVPRFDWFADSLASQLGDDEVEVIAVDGLHSPAREAEFTDIVARRFAFRHVPPKPTPYNGPKRLTQFEYFTAASARNTGIVYASKPYVAFADDAAVLMPQWWSEVRTAAGLGQVIGGSYRKDWCMVVDDGRLVSSLNEPSGLDSRWPQGSDHESVLVGGGQLYGCSLAAPRDLLLEINGFDELCDTIGGEDWQLGVRLELAGSRIYYSRRMLTIESEELHRQGVSLLRVDRTTTPTAYMQRLAEFGVTGRHVDGAWNSSHMLLDITFGRRSAQAVGNYYRLSELSALTFPQIEERFPAAHWFDGIPLSEL